MKNMFKFDIYRWGIFFEWLRYSKDWEKVNVIFTLHVGTRWEIFVPQKYITFRIRAFMFDVKEGSDHGSWGFDIPIYKRK